MAKFIICDCAKANWGKTTTLIEVEKLFNLSPLFSSLQRSDWGKDVWAVYERISDKRIFVIQTEGDYKKSFNNTIQYAKEGKVDIIICACRDDNRYKERVDYIAKTFAFEKIFFNNFCPSKKAFRKIPALNYANKVSLPNAIFTLSQNI